MSYAERDAAVNWHPYTQMQLTPRAVPVVRGEGAYLYDDQGGRLIDAVASWWVNLHGHCHPYIAERVYAQMQTLDHVIFAGFTHPLAIELSERLLRLLPHQQRVFYSDNGSTAVEIALKMAVQYWDNRGAPRRQVIYLEGAYHGDTFGAMAASERGAFTKPFQPLLFAASPLPVPTAGNLPAVLEQLRTLLARGDVAAFIFEPLVQGAGGFRMYEAAHLDQLIRLCRGSGVLCIADEVMTGFGRTGALFASDLLQVKPDITCLSKGITGGTMPFAATTCTAAVYAAFLASDRHKALLHGHSYTASAVACAAACASLDLLEGAPSQRQRRFVAAYFAAKVEELSGRRGLKAVRSLGTLFAAELDQPGAYFAGVGPRLGAFFLERGVLLRPLGSVFYLIPPYCIAGPDLDLIFATLEEFLAHEYPA